MEDYDPRPGVNRTIERLESQVLDLRLRLATARNEALEEAAIIAEIALAKTAAADIRRRRS